MTCPKCKKEIDHVFVFSECRQDGMLNGSGQIIDYSTVEYIGETTDIECPECHESLMEYFDGDSIHQNILTPIPEGQ